MNTKTFTRLVVLSAFMAPLLSKAQQAPGDLGPFSPSASYRSWSVGAGAGLMNQWNVIGFRRDFDHVSNQLGYNFYIKKQLTHTFGLRAEYMGGKLKGDKEQTQDGFSTSLPWSAALSADVNFANISWRYRRSYIQPFFSLGIGAFNYTARPMQNGIGTKMKSRTEAFIPGMVGIRFNIAEGFNINAAYQLNLVNTTVLDGRSTNRKDLYSYPHIGIEIALGNTKKPVLGNHNPVSDMEQRYQSDFSRLEHAVQQQRDRNGELSQQIALLTADDDQDGVSNKFDKCPGTASGAKVDGSGCPLPEVKQEIQQITITEEDRHIIDEAISNLEFDVAKSTIKASSFPSLDKVAALLESKHLSLKLSGHTDNTGSPQKNIVLSKARAEAIKSYLVGKGANPSRIEAIGYGSSQPIAPNTTSEGRQANRRVEFYLY